MRALFFLLVLANLLFYAWHAGYLGQDMASTGESARLSQQISPGSIHIISAEDARALASGKPKALACYDWGSFSAQDVERALVLLAAMNPPPRFTQRKVEEAAGWWVFLPPQTNKAAVDKRTTELKQLGVAEFYVVNDDGPNKFAISLGVFKTEDGARNYLEIMSRQGVKSARIAEREAKVTRTVLHFGEVDDGLKARLIDLKREFSNLDLKECAAEERKAESNPDPRPAEKKG